MYVDLCSPNLKSAIKMKFGVEYLTYKTNKKIDFIILLQGYNNIILNTVSIKWTVVCSLTRDGEQWQEAAATAT